MFTHKLPSPRRPILYLCGSFALFLGVLENSGFAQDMDALKQRFLQEAPRGWDVLNTHAFEIQGHVRMVMKVAGKEDFRGSWVIKAKPSNQLSQAEATDANGQMTYSVYAENAYYAFALKRKSADFPWVLTDIRKKQPGVDLKLPDDYRNEGIGQGIQTALTTPAWSKLADLVRQPSFQVRRAAIVNQDGLELVQIDFDNAHPLKQGQFEPVQSGTVLLDPERSWCLRGYEIHARFENALDVCRSDIIEIRDSSSPHIPLPVHIADTTISQATEAGYVGQRVTKSSDLRYDLLEPHPLPDNDFRLAAFGLPEPEGSVTQPWWSLWAIGASLLCIAAAGIWWWFLRRKAPKPAA
jgi:hypothetical protein